MAVEFVPLTESFRDLYMKTEYRTGEGYRRPDFVWYEA